MDRIKQINSFTGGMNTVLARKLLPPDTYEYMLNCNVYSSAEGNVGIVTNVKGTVEVPFDLPAGLNLTIGKAADEEKNNFYFFVYNSLGYHGIYQYNSVDEAVIKVMRCIEDTGDVDIFRWNERDLILQSNVVENNLLYWVVRGNERHPPRMINITKAMDKSSAGYGDIILEEYTRAYKKTAVLAPYAEYSTDETKKFNRLYGYQFKFCQRFVYDNGERSNWSDYSNLPVPDNESASGIESIPKNNNCIKIKIDTGSSIVDQIEVAMMRTDPDSGFMPWVIVARLDKQTYEIQNNSSYLYSFYNEGIYESTDPEKIIRPYSYLPKDPITQEFIDKALVYGNFHEGFEAVSVDVSATVSYEELFINDDVSNEFNNPSIVIQTLSKIYYTKGRETTIRVTIGADVIKGNSFSVWGIDGVMPPLEYYYVAKATDNATSVANYFRSTMLTNSRFIWGTPVTEDGSSNASFDIRFKNYGGSWFDVNVRGKVVLPYMIFDGSVTASQSDSLKNNGQSLPNIKNGSSRKYALIYYDFDGRNSSGYTLESLVINIDSVNALGGVKKPLIDFTINHIPPKWAYYWQIVGSADLVYGDYITLLIQKINTINMPDGEIYLDISIGSLFAYQKLHENTTLRFVPEKGDRIRFISHTDGSLNTFYPDGLESEVISYMPIVENTIKENITVDGTAEVLVASASEDNVGNYIRIGASEREILSYSSGKYTLNNPLSTGDPTNTSIVYPSFIIINPRGVVRIKKPSFDVFVSPDSDIFTYVEIYKSAASFVEGGTLNTYYKFGYKLPIIGAGTDTRYHGGNTQDQSISTPAIVRIDTGTSYVRNREFPLTTSEKPQIRWSLVEDPSYSDFYISNLNDNGKVVAEDMGDGERLFDERIRSSNSYIEGTRINGLNDFDNLDRQDYNDKYGAIELIWYEDGRLYIFKHLKDAWTPVYASIITDQSGTELLAKSDKLLGDKLQYYSWDGGVGDNPESVARLGTQFFHASPNSMIIARLGGNGVDPISTIYGVDPTVRDHIASAKKANARMFGEGDRHNNKYDLAIEKHDKVISDTPISASGWRNDVAELPSSGVTYSIVSGPSHGTLDLTDPTAPIYNPDPGYDGPDTFSYEAFVGGVSQGTRNACLTIVHQDGPPAWRPIGQFCVLNDGNRTGFQGWNTLEQYDTYHGTPTGVTKPNIVGDPDYVAPVYNIASCVPQESFILFSTTSTSGVFDFTVGSGTTPIIVEARNGSTVINTSLESVSGAKQLDLSSNTGTATILVRGPIGVDTKVISVVSDNNSVVSENMSVFPSVQTVHFRDNNLNALTLTPASNPALVSLAYNNNSVNSFNPSGLQNLDTIDGRSNGINTILLQNLPVLRSIAFNNNNLTVIGTNELPKLEWVELTFNQLTPAGYDFTNNPLIKTLLLASNPGINSFDESKVAGVTWLTLDRTGITGLNMTLLPSIVSLDITQCPIPTFSIATNDSLMSLRCGECTFTNDTALPADIDAIIIKMDSNIITGGTLHYDTLTPLGVQPSSASLSAYNSLVAKGTNLQGKVPL